MCLTDIVQTLLLRAERGGCVGAGVPQGLLAEPLTGGDLRGPHVEQDR